MTAIMADNPPVFCNPFSTGDFPPRWDCGNWTLLHGWTHIIADLAIFGAYAAIPALIAYFVIKRKQVQLPSLWWLFAAFIFFCGFGHLVEATIFWHPWYRFSAIIKVVTALVSWGTVIVLARHMPALLNLPGMHQLNRRLREEIDARAKTEAERERFFNLSIDLLCIADVSGRFTRVNPAFAATLGFTEEEFTATPFIEFVHPDDREATLRELSGLREGKPTLTFQNRYRTKAGGWRWLSWKATPWPEGGLIYATARDITQQRLNEENILHLNTNLEKIVAQRTAEAAASEERFRLMVEQVQDYAIYMLDCDGRVVSWNSGAQRAKGYAAAEIVGRHFSCFYTPEDIAEDKPARLLADARARGRVNAEGWRVRRDGSRFWAEVVLTAIQGQDGSLRGFAKVTRDLTERKKSEAQSMRSQRLESIGTLAGGIAHDLNNALAPVLMGMEILRAKHPESSEMLTLIEGSATRGADMVKHLLTFAKGVEGARVAVSPARLITDVDRIIHSTFPKNIQLVTHVPDDTPPMLGDPTQLHQVLLNLCVNARDAMPGGGRITIEATAVEVDAAFASTLNTDDAALGSYVRLRVTDTGTGIPPEIVDRIFDPFFTTKAPDRGSGLGLSNCLGIVKGHGGFFHVLSQPGRGTAIAAYLPVARGKNPGVERASAPPIEIRGHGEQVLFVDDEESVRTVARSVLAALGYSALTATDGTDALIQTAQFRQTLHTVVTDLHMPHMDGEALVRALRRMSPDLPIIIASGRVDESTAERLRLMGVKNILPKPFTQEQLGRAIAAHRQESSGRTRSPFGGGTRPPF